MGSGRRTTNHLIESSQLPISINRRQALSYLCIDPIKCTFFVRQENLLRSTIFRVCGVPCEYELWFFPSIFFAVTFATLSHQRPHNNACYCSSSRLSVWMFSSSFTTALACLAAPNTKRNKTRNSCELLERARVLTNHDRFTGGMNVNVCTRTNEKKEVQGRHGHAKWNDFAKNRENITNFRNEDAHGTHTHTLHKMPDGRPYIIRCDGPKWNWIHDRTCVRLLRMACGECTVSIISTKKHKNAIKFICEIGGSCHLSLPLTDWMRRAIMFIRHRHRIGMFICLLSEFTENDRMPQQERGGGRRREIESSSK